jgi:nitrite reductase (NO-forming)
MKMRFAFAAICAASTIFYACGSNTEKAETSAASPATPKATGTDIYNRTCITCHQANGEGLPNTFPPLAKSDYLVDKERAITQVIKGSSGEIVVNGKKFNNTMPPQPLNDEEIATVLTYVYGNFGNTGGTVTPDEVKAIRAKLK